MGRHPNSDIDRFIGHRIKQLRGVECMTQQQVGEKLGISHQQVHKIEKAVQRISAGQLFAIAGVLRVTVSDLLEGYGSTPAGPAVDAETTRLLLDLRRTFLALEPKHQEALVRLTQALATADCPDAVRKNGQRSAEQERASPPARNDPDEQLQ